LPRLGPFRIFAKPLNEAGMHMTASVKSLGIDRLPIDERLTLVEDIWDSIAADTGVVPLTDAQRIELEKPIAADGARPDDVTPWEQVKAS
jgi:putative addiction module component (TIGR02574 family)